MDSRTRRDALVAVAVVVVALAYLLVPWSAVADSISSVYGKGATGYPVPIGASGDRLKVEATEKLIAPDGGLVEAKGSAEGATFVEVTNSGDSPVLTQQRLTTPDGGTTAAAGSALGATMVAPEGGSMAVSTPAGGSLETTETGYESSTVGCIEVTCAANGSPDAGIDRLSPSVGVRYVSTVSDNSGIRVNDRAPCVAYAGGNGRLLNAGSTMDWQQQANGLDGGTAAYRCCAQTPGTVWQLCPKN